MLRAVLLTGLLMLLPAADAARVPSHLVCYDDLFEPFFMLRNGAYTGVTADLLAEAGRRAGIAVEFRHMPWRRLEAELARPGSSVACAFALSHTPAREALLDFGKVALLPTEYAVFVRTDSPVRSLAALDGHSIGLRAGVRVPDAVTQGARAGRWRLAEVASDLTNFQKLLLGRVDAVLADTTIGLYTIRQAGLTGIRRLDPPLEHFDTFVVFPKSAQSAATAAAFDQALEQMHQDGSFDRLVEAYLGEKVN